MDKLSKIVNKVLSEKKNKSKLEFFNIRLPK